MLVVYIFNKMLIAKRNVHLWQWNFKEEEDKKKGKTCHIVKEMVA